MHEEYSDLIRPWHEPIVSDEAETYVDAPAKFDDVKHKSALEHAYNEMAEVLQLQLLAHIHAQPFEFFENLVLDVALALGVGGRRRDLSRKLGRSGDGGVDGIVELDELGLDVIYLQAKRIKPSSSIGSPAIRDFIGSLETHRATKGIFFTTGTFTQSAIKTSEASSRRVVLIDGCKLTSIMLRHSIGTKVTTTFQFKELDLSYFSKPQNRTHAMASAQSR